MEKDKIIVELKATIQNIEKKVIENCGTLDEILAQSYKQNENIDKLLRESATIGGLSTKNEIKIEQVYGFLQDFKSAVILLLQKIEQKVFPHDRFAESKKDPK